MWIHFSCRKEDSNHGNWVNTGEIKSCNGAIKNSVFVIRTIDGIIIGTYRETWETKLGFYLILVSWKCPNLIYFGSTPKGKGGVPESSWETNWFLESKGNSEVSARLAFSKASKAVLACLLTWFKMSAAFASSCSLRCFSSEYETSTRRCVLSRRRSRVFFSSLRQSLLKFPAWCLLLSTWSPPWIRWIWASSLNFFRTCFLFLRDLVRLFLAELKSSLIVSVSESFVLLAFWSGRVLASESELDFTTSSIVVVGFEDPGRFESWPDASLPKRFERTDAPKTQRRLDRDLQSGLALD